MTMTRNPELEAISYEKETAEKERKAAYGLRLPKASVTGAYIYMGDDMAIDMNDLKAPVGGVLEGLGNLPNIPPAILQQASSLLAKGLVDETAGPQFRQRGRQHHVARSIREEKSTRPTTRPRSRSRR